MPYDDGSSIFNFKDWEELAALLQETMASSGQLSLARVIALAEALHLITAGRQLASLDVHHLAEGLRQKGLGSMPFDTVMHVAEVVSKIGAHEDVLGKITLRDLHGLTARRKAP